MRRYLQIAGVVSILAVSFPDLACAQGTPEPWRQPQDTTAAVFDTDRYAWRLFVALSWPANAAAKEADPAKAFGSPGSVVWETWRSIYEAAPDTVFPPNGADPGPWLGGPVVVAARTERQFEPIPRKELAFLAAQQIQRRPGQGPVVVFDAAVGGGNEIRMNQAAYEFIRQNKLYNVQGQIAQFASGKANLKFPLDAKEIKAQWRKIRESDKPRYHWAEVTRNTGAKEIWGLTALHIITKDLPNWLWATFEHVDNKQPGPLDGGFFNVGWLTRSVDRFACPAPPHDCEQAPQGIGLQGTKWENYRLRGTQIDFIDSMGVPTLLGNSQIEASFQKNSSCINCHARAAINRDATTDPGFFPPVLGSPNPDLFRDPITRQRTFMQLDFVWSLRRASAATP
jgi:hypothetical protein